MTVAEWVIWLTLDINICLSKWALCIQLREINFSLCLEDRAFSARWCSLQLGASWQWGLLAASQGRALRWEERLSWRQWWLRGHLSWWNWEDWSAPLNSFKSLPFRFSLKNNVIAFCLLESWYNLILCDPSLNVKYFTICQGVAICYCKAGLQDLKFWSLLFSLSGMGQCSMWQTNKSKWLWVVFRESEGLQLRMITESVDVLVQAHAYLIQETMLLVGTQILQFMCSSYLLIMSFP